MQCICTSISKNTLGPMEISLLYLLNIQTSDGALKWPLKNVSFINKESSMESSAFTEGGYRHSGTKQTLNWGGLVCSATWMLYYQLGLCTA